jgi:outer membrane protein, adhesin transport system
VLFYKEQTRNGAEAEGCPTSLINLEDFDLPNIGFDEALKSVDASSTLAPIQLAQLDNGSNGQQVASLGDPAEVSKSLIDKTKAWARAWENKDLNSYIAFYAPTFKPEEGSYEAWVSSRRERISKAQGIDIEISDLQVIPSFDNPDEYEISFVQDYKARFYQERSRKVLTWKDNKGIWQIIREKNMPISAVTGPGKKNLNLAEAGTVD